MILIEKEPLQQQFENLAKSWRGTFSGPAYTNALERLKNAPTVNAVRIPESGIGDLSDGCHTFNEMYHHRAVLFSVICNMHPLCSWKSKKHHDGSMYEGMFIVGINTPEGQATYHYNIDPYWDMFKVPEAEFAPEWDGHSPDEAIRRIGLLDAEDVVRCEDCFANGCCSVQIDLEMGDQGYCSMGRREGE